MNNEKYNINSKYIKNRLVKHLGSDIKLEKNFCSKQKIVTLEQLLKFDSVQFITNLYRELLLREPDYGGLKHYLKLMLEGTSKEVLIYLFAISSECKRNGVQVNNIEHIKKQYIKYKIKRLLKKTPIIWLYRTIMLPKRIHEIIQEFALTRMEFECKQKFQEQKLSEISMELKVLESTLHNEVNSNEVNSIIENMQKNVKKFNHILNSMTEDIQGNYKQLSLNVSETISDFRNDINWLRNNINKRVITSSNDVSVVELDGFILGIPSDEWRMVSYIALKGHLEPGLIKLFKSSVEKGMKIIDVGANIGIYTLVAAKQVGDEGKVYSFEPTPRTFNLLRDNIQVNGLLETDRVVLSNLAITDRTSTRKFAVYDNNSGHNTLYPKNDTDTTIKVETNSLDEVVGDDVQIDIVKIDVEGSEPLVLKGMKRIIDRNPGILIFMEFAPEHLKRAGTDLEFFINEICNFGLKIQRIDDETGELLQVSHNELISCISMNIMLSRNVATTKKF